MVEVGIVNTENLFFAPSKFSQEITQIQKILKT